ncbi:hypothetical protein LWC33_07260 [Pseudonocardia sp. RS11V-5]|uniref:hypothetical protein n=1 Tax=Pseudonocardia terrae TaxID=2905831 RepID=UPI001E3B704F|nr:hypothetical protein [Pseudonocardia terrae]MCE3551254.1 hypothetical protein [Pseudonocardia terrae]
MRMLLIAQPDVDKGSAAVVSGDMAKTVQATIELIQPEATYFAPVRGRRTFIAVFDLDDPAQLPKIQEPLFRMGAVVEIVPAMNLEDLQRGLAAIGG